MRQHAIAAGLILAVAVVPSFAQHRGLHVGTSVRGSAPAREAHIPRTLYLGTPLWFDDYPARDSAAPSVIVVQAPAPPAASAGPVFEEPKPAAPLLIEWQGDRYVRRTSGVSNETNPAPVDYAAPAKGNSAPRTPQQLSPASSKTPAPAEPAPATFIFRDGHREQSSDYTIVSGVIYVRGDYWTTGSWTRKIPIAQLNIPATLRANADLGVPFRLPSAPNEIITRP